MRSRRLGFLLSLLALGCSSNVFLPPQPARPGDPHGKIRFRVYANTPEESVEIQDWPFIPVYLVSASGRALLGKTDATGAIEIPKDSIWSPGAIALLFCRDADFIECSALTVDTGYLRGFDEYNVQLPRFVLLD